MVCSGIRRVHLPQLAVVGLLAALLLCVALPASAFASPAKPAGHKPFSSYPPPELGQAEAVWPPPPPQLLLFHGGGFIDEDPLFEPATIEAAKSFGFEPHYVIYPLGNFKAALLDARAEAKKLREESGGVEHVYAFGWSAGGTLASLLAEEGLVAAAAAKAPVSDLVSWEWPYAVYGADYYERIGLSLEDRERFSPDRRPVKNPLLIYQGRGDNVVPSAMNEAFAAESEEITFWSVSGGHATDRARPWLIENSMRWLAHMAAKKEREAAREEALE